MTARPSDLSIAESAPAASGQHRYLAFVDGLRAVSILAVVGFHTGVP